MFIHKETIIYFVIIVCYKDVTLAYSLNASVSRMFVLV